MRWWKWLGLAGLLGAAAAGAVVVNRKRARRWTNYEPTELRARLHARLAASRAADAPPTAAAGGTGADAERVTGIEPA